MSFLPSMSDGLRRKLIDQGEFAGYGWASVRVTARWRMNPRCLLLLEYLWLLRGILAWKIGNEDLSRMLLCSMFISGIESSASLPLAEESLNSSKFKLLLSCVSENTVDISRSSSSLSPEFALPSSPCCKNVVNGLGTRCDLQRHCCRSQSSIR
jgi:hypothetical protein